MRGGGCWQILSTRMHKQIHSGASCFHLLVLLVQVQSASGTIKITTQRLCLQQVKALSGRSSAKYVITILYSKTNRNKSYTATR